jgi:predicted AAA+ superfamily ATPase
MNEAVLLDVLNKNNPWWASKPIPELKIKPFQRRDVEVYKKEELERKEITGIIGPRRVGKTISMHQLIQHLLDKKIPPKNILFVSMDSTELKGENPLRDLLEVYSKFIIQKPLDSLKEKHYVFLDEIQELPNWSKNLKNWYDLGYNLKFFISGSSSTDILHGSSESLLGRLSIKIMPPLKFSEIVRYHGLKDDLENVRFRNNILCQDIEEENVERLFKNFQTLYGNLSPLKDELEILLNKYLIKGGYPELLNVEDLNEGGRLLQTKIQLTFYKDVIRVFKIREPKTLEELFSVLSKESSQRFNVLSLAKNLGIERPTLKEYLSHLESIFLISLSEHYSKSRVSRVRKEKKIYVCDVGVRNAAVNRFDSSVIADNVEVGRLTETVLFDHLKRLKFVLEPGLKPEVFYWKDNGKELDAVVELCNKPIPFEVKYQNTISRQDTAILRKFVKKHDSPFGILITKNHLNQDDNILHIPLWILLTII